MNDCSIQNSFINISPKYDGMIEVSIDRVGETFGVSIFLFFKPKGDPLIIVVSMRGKKFMSLIYRYAKLRLLFTSKDS